MTMRQPGLALISCVYMVQLVTYTNGEVTPPWITLLGCFDAEIGSQSIQLPGNSPTNCFKECKNFSYVGMQDNNCICSKEFQNISDLKNAALRPYTQCRRGDNRFMSLYAKVSSLPNTINQDADYGHVYVTISSSSSYEFHASKESPERHGFICFDFSNQCRYRTSMIDRMTSELAWNECNLVSYFDFDLCLNRFVIETGDFWIGIYRDFPDFSSTSSTLSTKISTLASPSTPTATSQLATDTPSPLTTDTQSTTSLKVEAITPTTSPFPTENRASKAMLEGTWKNVAIVFIVVSGVLLVVIPMLVVFLRLKKDTHIRHDDEHGSAESHKTPNAKAVPQLVLPNNGTLGDQASNGQNKPSQFELHLPGINDHKRIISDGTCARDNERKEQETKSNHLDHSEHEMDGGHIKKHKKKKKKKHKRKKRHSDATKIIIGENAS